MTVHSQMTKTPSVVLCLSSFTDLEIAKKKKKKGTSAEWEDRKNTDLDSMTNPGVCTLPNVDICFITTAS